MVNEGDKVLINGKEYVLGARLGGGQEGSVFNVVDFPKHAIKVINDSNMSSLQRNEVYNHLKWVKNLAVQRKIISQYMAVPKAILDDKLGYIMLKADEHASLKEYLTPPDDPDGFDNWYKTGYTFKKRYQIIANLFSALREIHLAGLIFTDLSPNNIMVHKRQNQIVFIDTDNTRRRTDSYLGVIGTPGYMAPEVYRKPNAVLAKAYNVDPQILSTCGRITPESDIFSAAIIAFQLLTLQHPFIGDEIEEGTAEDETRALEIKTDFIFKPGTTNSSTFGLTTKYEEITTPQIRKLFERVFVDGRDYPGLRPTDDEFFEAFQEAADLIVECPHCGFSRLYDSGSRNDCINCGSSIGPKVVMVVYNCLKDMRNDEAINSFGDYPEFDISLDSLKTSDGKLLPSYYEVSRIVLEPGEAKAKYLYLHHFENTIEKSMKFARVTLSDGRDKVKVEMLNDVYSSPNLIEKRSRRLIPMNKGKIFPIEDYGIIFETKRFGKGFIQIFAKFVEE